MYRSLARYPYSLYRRFLLLAETERLKGEGIRFPKDFSRKIWSNPARWEDMVHLKAFSEESKAKTLIDVGANKGSFTADFLYSFPSTSVHAFEPVKATFADLEARHCEEPNVKLYNIAISSDERTAEIHTGGYSGLSSLERYTSGGGIGRPEQVHAESEVIECKSLDGLELDFADTEVVLKVDVQGHELDVIEGASETLKRVDLCLIELSFADQYQVAEPSFVKCTQALRTAGLYPIVFQEFGRAYNSYGFERDVLFVRRPLLRKAWWNSEEARVTGDLRADRASSDQLVSKRHPQSGRQAHQSLNT